MYETVTIRFRDFRFRTVETYGKEIYTTNSTDEARKYMKDNEKEMRFLVGGGRMQNGEHTEIYWDIVDR